MIKKDYIQRYFDELGKVIGAIMLLKKEKKYEEAKQTIDDFSTSFLDLNIDELLSLNENDFLSFLTNDKKFSLEHLKILEELLYHKLLLDLSNGELKVITVKLMEYITQNDRDFSFARVSRIKELSI